MRGYGFPGSRLGVACKIAQPIQPSHSQTASTIFFILITFFFLNTKYFCLRRLISDGIGQSRHGEFEPGKVQYSTQNFFWPLVSYKNVLKPKIWARTKPCQPCLPWRPCRQWVVPPTSTKDSYRDGWNTPHWFSKIWNQ